MINLCNNKRPTLYIKEELQLVDELLDDGILNRLLLNEGDSRAMRDIYLCNLFRVELFNAIRYPEVIYPNFCIGKILRPGLKTEPRFYRLVIEPKRPD